MLSEQEVKSVEAKECVTYPGNEYRPAVNIVGNKDNLNDWLWEQTKGIVQTGPFQGMQLPDEESWSDGNKGNKCLGCYEQELHDAIEIEIVRLLELERPKIVNLGCAEGYYAVGLARRLPKAWVDIVDRSDEALRICTKAADLNKVTVHYGGELSVILNEAHLIVSDCEGAEVDYLDMKRFPGLIRASIILEVHDFSEMCLTDVMYERFKDTHDVRITMAESIRAPVNYELLWRLPSHARWLAVSEGRPCSQNFMYLRPK